MDNHDFEIFYTNTIAPSLPKLREECRQADSWGSVGVIAALLGLCSFAGYYLEYYNGTTVSLLFSFFTITVIVAVYKYAKRNDRFSEDFKEAVIKKIIDYVQPGLVYKPGEWISPREYKTSGLYRYQYDYYDGDDYIEGTIDGVNFHCSELHTQSDYAVDRQETIFKGLFFVAKINNRFAGGTYVSVRDRSQLVSLRLDQYCPTFPRPKTSVIRLDDAEFDHWFKVRSTWPSQSAEILNAVMRTNILNIANAIKLPLSISFVAGKCFIAIPIKGDLFETSDYDPGDKEEIRKHFISIGLITQMLKQLGLAELQ